MTPSCFRRNYRFFFWPSGSHAVGPLCVISSVGCLRSWRICDSLQQSVSGSGLCPGWCFSRLLWKTKAQSQFKTVSLSLWVINLYALHPIKDLSFEFNSCFLAPNIISSGRRATVVLRFGIKLNEPLKFPRTSRSPQNRNQVRDNCCILHPHTFSSKPPPFLTVSYNSSLPILSLSFFFFYSKAADERSRWFVLWLVSAPLSPLSDHLHLLLSNATRLWSCVCVCTLDCNTCQRLAACKICHFWSSN